MKISGKDIEYDLRKRKGARSMRLAIYPDGRFVVTAPKWCPLYAVDRFIREKSEWIWERLKHIDFAELAVVRREEGEEYKVGKKSAAAAIRARVQFLNENYGFSYNRISIRNQKTCWGSCSQKGNLNFNYKVADLPDDLRDYVIVHELCHLRELNHSKQFWILVEKTIPDCKERRKKLRCEFNRF